MAANTPSPATASPTVLPCSEEQHAVIAAIDPILARVGGRNQLLLRIETEDGSVIKW
ncbi:hypothetical protein [Antarctobacter sp.]|uniref:hypothetical protein n=1 Tax=Antarctobacter sp. TaxID=1872577 RepID=UPI002B26A888|nr:hypothetical protein [Antarctobacter sp.]